MKRNQKRLGMVVSCLVMLVALLVATSAFAVNLKGKINDKGEFVSKDGTVYTVVVAKGCEVKGRPTAGMALTDEVGKEVQVKGDVAETSGEQKTINVKSYYVY